MARVFMDGAEGNDLTFWGAQSGVSVSAAQKRSGDYSYYLNGNGCFATRNLVTGLSEFCLRFGLRIGGLTTERLLLSLRNSTTTAADLRYEPTTAKLKAYVNGALVGSASVSLAAAAWGRVEVYYKMADSGGVYDVKLDGVTVISFSGDTKPSTYTTIDNFHFTANTSFDFWIDDLALNDMTGDTHNSWCGDGHIELRRDAGNGDRSDWAGSDGNSVDNYLLVDDVTPDGDATYIFDSTPGNQDMSTVESWDGTYKQVQFAWPEMRVRGETGNEQLTAGVKTNGAVHMDSAQALTTQYSRVVGYLMEVNPQSLLPWSEAEINAAQSVVETAAV